MNPKTRIKVSRVRLIEALENRRGEEADRYAEEEAAYERDAVAYPKAVGDFLTDLAKRVRSGALKPAEAMDRYHWRDEGPETPHKPSSPRSYATAIAQLGMSNEVDISISAEDFAAYIR